MSASFKPWIWVTSDIWKLCKYIIQIIIGARHAEIGDYELLKCIFDEKSAISRCHKLCKHRNNSKCPDVLYFSRADVSKIPQNHQKRLKTLFFRGVFPKMVRSGQKQKSIECVLAAWLNPHFWSRKARFSSIWKCKMPSNCFYTCQIRWKSWEPVLI